MRYVLAAALSAVGRTEWLGALRQGFSHTVLDRRLPHQTTAVLLLWHEHQKPAQVTFRCRMQA